MAKDLKEKDLEKSELIADSVGRFSSRSIEMIDYNDCNLYMSLRSPFARRVRLAFLEHRLSFRSTTIDVFNPPTEFAEINPLLRVPAVVLKDGSMIVDSHSILNGFYETHSSSALIPKVKADREITLKWSGIAVGLSELLVQFFLEKQREKSRQDERVFEELRAHFQRTLQLFETEIAGKDFIARFGLSQADLDMGTALTYLKLRWNALALDDYPAIAKYLAGLDRRPSFHETTPPL